MSSPSTAVTKKGQETMVSSSTMVTIGDNAQETMASISSSIGDKILQEMVSSSTAIGVKRRRKRMASSAAIEDKGQTSAVSSTTTLDKRQRRIAVLDKKFLQRSIGHTKLAIELAKRMRTYNDVKRTPLRKELSKTCDLVDDVRCKISEARFEAYCKKDRALEAKIKISNQKCKNEDDPAVVREKKLRLEYEEAILALSNYDKEEKKLCDQFRQELVRFEEFLKTVKGRANENKNAGCSAWFYYRDILD